MAKIQLSDITISNLISDKFIKELPEIYALKKNIENNPWHLNQTTFSHTMLSLKALIRNFETYKHLETYLDEIVEKNPRKTILFIATLYHDIAKPITRKLSKENWTTFPIHEAMSAKYTRTHLKKLDLTAKEIDLACKIIKDHDLLHIATNRGSRQNPATIEQRTKGYFIELLLLNKSDTEGSNLQSLNRKDFDQRIIFYKKMLQKAGN